MPDTIRLSYNLDQKLGAGQLANMNAKKYYLNLFLKDKLTEGSEEIISAMSEIEKDPQWDDSASSARQKEIAKKVLKEVEDKIEKADYLIDQIVYHLYGLTENEVKVIEDFFNNT